MKFDKGEWVERENYRKKILAELGDGVMIQVVQVPRGNVVSEHYHLKQREFYYILRGKARLRIGKEQHEARAGDSFLCKPKETHSVDNSKGKEPFELLVLKLNYHGEDSVWL